MVCCMNALNTSVMTARPAMTGSTPLSPARTRAAHSRRYSPSVCATISGGTSSSATLVAAVGSGGRSGASTRAIGASAGHVLDDTLAVEGRRRVLEHHPPQVEDGNAVGHLDHVVQVVGHDD